MLKKYFAAIAEVAKRGDAREESFYSCLEKLLELKGRNSRNSHFNYSNVSIVHVAGQLQGNLTI